MVNVVLITVFWNHESFCLDANHDPLQTIQNLTEASANAKLTTGWGNQGLTCFSQSFPFVQQKVFSAVHEEHPKSIICSLNVVQPSNMCFFKSLLGVWSIRNRHHKHLQTTSINSSWENTILEQVQYNKKHEFNLEVKGWLADLLLIFLIYAVLDWLKFHGDLELFGWKLGWDQRPKFLPWGYGFGPGWRVAIDITSHIEQRISWMNSCCFVGGRELVWIYLYDII